jgi:hypothetical protein
MITYRSMEYKYIILHLHSSFVKQQSMVFNICKIHVVFKNFTYNLLLQNMEVGGQFY